MVKTAQLLATRGVGALLGHSSECIPQCDHSRIFSLHITKRSEIDKKRGVI